MNNAHDALTKECPCCANLGDIPHFEGFPELVDNTTVIKMCFPCIGAAFLGTGAHPHSMDGIGQ